MPDQRVTDFDSLAGTLDFASLNLEPQQQDDDERGVWSIVCFCFYVRRDHHKLGLSAQLLDAAVKLAKNRGAKAVEGCPVTPDSASYRFMGFVGQFEAHQFEPAGQAGSRRHVMRRAP